MNDPLLLGFWRFIFPISRIIWERQMRGEPTRLDFMSAGHHRVRDFVVTELPRTGKPLEPADIARALTLPIERVLEILDELEQNMTFLFRNPQGAVEWAYPVTTAATPHHVTFSTGERINAA
ncbi:MAG: hypothetical protein EHM45_01745 [Desulfobacteraceae bacterium]|nr:MAG: hypothetical protein EHM45_01745 [Desulfobacteraceae bacterium]